MKFIRKCRLIPSHILRAINCGNHEKIALNTHGSSKPCDSGGVAWITGRPYRMDGKKSGTLFG